jgi:hypothetical protein
MPETMRGRSRNLQRAAPRPFPAFQCALMLICLSAGTSLALSGQAVPLPEYFGVYALVDGTLIQLDSQHVSAPSYVTVLMGHRSGVGNILQGQAVASSTQARIPRFSPNLKIIVYSQKSGLESPLDTARSLHLESLAFVRNVNVDTGWPNNVRRSGVENGWEAGDAPELLGIASGDHAKQLEFRIRSAPGHQDMVIAELVEPLSPGVYSLRLGERNPWSNSSGFLFAVDPVGEGITRHCVDASVKYSMNLSKNSYTPCGGNSAAPAPTATPPPQLPRPSGVLLETFAGSTAGAAFGISYNSGAVFSRGAESRIEYRSGIPTQGTLEWWLKVDNGYRFDNFVLHPQEGCAQVFATDVQGGDVTWPGTTRVIVCNSGQITLDMAQAKYNDMPHQVLTIPSSQFRFAEWHALGISYGSQGQAIMLDGQMLGSTAGNTQTLGAAGTHQGPADVPTIGEAISHFWQHRQYSGGFDGVVSRFRASPNQLDWVLAKERPQSDASSATSTTTPCVSARNAGYSLTLNGQNYRVFKLGPAGPQTPPVFFERAGAQVKDANLIPHLATAVWVHDNIVADPSYRTQPRSQVLLSLIQTSIALQGYQHTQDLVVRGSVELLAAVVSDGAIANPMHIVKAGLAAAKPDPTEWMAASTVVGLHRSIDRYRSMEKLLVTFSGNEFDAAALEQIYNLYLEALGFEQMNRPVLVAIEPTHWNDLAKQAMWSAGSQALSVILDVPEGAAAGDFVQRLYDVTQTVQAAGEVNDLYKQWVQGLKFSHDYAAAVHRLVARWTNSAAVQCR